jgi:cold-inducible RNA-binding protein
MKLYLGNLAAETTDAQLGDLVKAFGTPQSAEMAKDRSSGQSRGFGFVEFSSDEEAKAAIAGLDGKEINGRVLKVNESRPKGGPARG